MKKPHYVVWVIVAIGAGLAIGLLAGNAPHARMKTAAKQAAERAHAIRSFNSVAVAKARTFESMVRRFNDNGRMPKAATEFLARASRTEIFASMESLVSLLGLESDFAAGLKARSALSAAAREIYSREGLAGVEWAETHCSMEVARTMINELSRNDVVLAKEHSRIFAEKFETTQRSWGFDMNGMQGAAMRSAADLLQAEEVIEGYTEVTEFAADFDFAGYLAKSTAAENIRTAYEYLAAKDPEMAANALRKDAGSEDLGWWERCQVAFKGRAALVGEQEAADWIFGVINSFSGEKRKRAVWGLGASGVTLERVEALMGHLPEERDRMDLAVAALGFEGMDDSAVRAIGAQASEDFRVKVADTWLKNTAADWVVMDDTLERLMDRLRLPEAKRKALREELSNMPPVSLPPLENP